MVDREIGRILDELERSGRARDTIVIFGTDHGDQLLEHGLVDKNVFFEASVHVPLLVRLPGRIEPGKRREMTEMVDVMPSVLKLCGVPVPPRIQGRNFSPREMVFCENTFRRSSPAASAISISSPARASKASAIRTLKWSARSAGN